jgi:hypothetical protein
MDKGGSPTLALEDTSLQIGDDTSSDKRAGMISLSSDIDGELSCGRLFGPRSIN